jgi:hypothetical protein
VREGGLEDESLVNEVLRVHFERCFHPGSLYLLHFTLWKDSGIPQPACQMLTFIDQPIRNHRASEETVQSSRLQDSRKSMLRYAHRISQPSNHQFLESSPSSCQFSNQFSFCISAPIAVKWSSNFHSAPPEPLMAIQSVLGDISYSDSKHRPRLMM